MDAEAAARVCRAERTRIGMEWRLGGVGEVEITARPDAIGGAEDELGKRMDLSRSSERSKV